MPKIELKNENEPNITFKQRIRNKFKKQIDRIVSHYQLNTLVLVLDELTAKILSRLFDMIELVDLKITFLQRLQKKRKPLDFHALYFVAASLDNIQHIVSDFQDQDKPQYKKVHILFTSFVDRKHLKHIAQCKPLFKKISKHSIKQFNFELRFLAENAVSMDIQYFSNAYGSDSPQQTYQQGLIAKKFIQIIAGYDQINVIRIYYQKSPNLIAERLAKRILKQAKTFFDELMDSKSHSISDTASDLTFFIVDRSIDVITPVLHSFSHESLLFDVLKIAFEGTQQSNNPQYRKFEEIQDQIYEKIRFNHISVSMEWLHQTLTEKNQELKSLGAEGLDLKKLTNEIKLLEKHITMSLAMIEKFNQKKLNEIGQLQQCIATGIYDNGKATSSVQVLKSAINVIKNNIAISAEQKLRLAIICLCGIKTSKADYIQLLNLFNKEDQKVLKNLVVLGVNYDSSITKSTKAFDNLYRNQAKQRLERTNMPLDRYSNTLETILPKLVNDIKQNNKSWKDSIEYIGRQFISILTEPSPKEKFDQSKFVCFVCGGLSFAELCSLKKQKSMQNIILATDSIMSPSKFIKELRKINKLEPKSLK